MAESAEPPPLNRDVRETWNQLAGWWDDTVGAEGNAAHRLMIGPATERLLNLQPGESVLDCACGNGQFSRRMAQLGAKVVAFDFSQVFLERARARSIEFTGSIAYHLIDAADESQLLALGEREFDAAVCTMALMDMATIDPLLSALRRLLKPGGRFVFSVTHPCFNSSPAGITKIVEEQDQEGRLETAYSLKVSKYLTPLAARGLGIPGQPVAHFYFHRPLHVLMNTCFRYGFVMDGLEEPATGDAIQANRPFSWSNFPEFPPFLLARLHLSQ